MNGMFQGNRFNRRILYYHLVTVATVLTVTLLSAYFILQSHQAQLKEQHLSNKLSINHAQIIDGLMNGQTTSISLIEKLFRVEQIRLLCLYNRTEPRQVYSWPTDQVEQCDTLSAKKDLVTASWSEVDSNFELFIYGQTKPPVTAMTITIIWFLAVILSLVLASYLIIVIADRKFTRPLKELHKSLSRFTLKPYHELSPSMTIETVCKQVNQLIDTTRQQELDLLESKDKFAALYSALQESEEYYRALFEQANEGILMMMKPNLRFTHFNQTALNILHYERSSFANLTISDIVASAEHDQHTIDVMATEIPASFVANMITSAGEDRICRVNSADMRIQDKEYRMMMFHDISIQRAAQKELLTLNSRLQTVLDASRHIAIIAVDQKGLIEIFNKGAETILGYRREEMIGNRHLIDVIQHCQIPETKENDELMFKDMVQNVYSDSPLTSACIYVDSDNKEVPVEQTLTRIIDDQGNHYGYLCIAIDLRERLAEQKRQNELESQLHHSQKMETIGTLAGGIAHDLNNLLTPVMGYTEMLLEDSKDNEKHQRRLTRILNASLRAKELVKQILTFSHNVDHFSEPVLIKDIVKEVLDLMLSSLPPNIHLTVDVKDPEARIFADVTKIHQVLMNLCTNAAHAIGDKNGTITIEINQIDYDENTGDLVLPTGKYAMMVVRDDGCGISSSARQRIFEPFFTTKEVGEGTGLGLSVVHGIVHSHNGTIRVKSKKNKGSHFYIYLPYYEEKHITPEPKVPETLGSGKRIMIVDDDEPVLQLTEELLKRKGFYVEAFSESRKALQALRLIPDAFDMIITDQSMPELSGTEMTRELRTFNTDIPVILLTGLGKILTTEEQSELGIAKIVNKPVLSNDLMQIIYEVT